MSIYCGQEASKQGTSGSSGCSGHYDFSGCGYIKEKSSTPDCFVKIIKFRNDMKSKEWCSSFEHDVHGSTQEECNEKGRIMLERVQKKFDEIDKKYDPIDDAIFELAKLIGAEINLYDYRKEKCRLKKSEKSWLNTLNFINNIKMKI